MDNTGLPPETRRNLNSWRNVTSNVGITMDIWLAKTAMDELCCPVDIGGFRVGSRQSSESAFESKMAGALCSDTFDEDVSNPGSGTNLQTECQRLGLVNIATAMLRVVANFGLL